MSLTVSARVVPLRIVSETSVMGVEEARSLLFDHYGMMWLGTDQGVRAFDGYRFHSIRSDAYTPGILPNNFVNSLAEGSDDYLWIGTRDGVVRHNRRQGTFRTYHLRGDQARSITALFTSSDGTVWVGTDAGVSRYDAENDDFIDINLPEGVRSFAEDRKGNLYIGSWEGGLLRLDRKTGNMVRYQPMNDRNTVASMLVDSRGRLWIGTWEHGIIRLDRPDDEHDPGIHRMNENRPDFRTFHRLVEDSVSHSVWGCCIEGLTRVDIDDATDVENYPVLTFCYDMLSDGQGNLWVMARGRGIVHLSTSPSPFRFCSLNPRGQVLPVNRIQSLYTPDGRWFWLGLQPYGLALYDRETGSVLYNNQIPGMEQLVGVHGIHVQNIPAIIECGDDEIWMACDFRILIWRRDQPVLVVSSGNSPFMGGGTARALHRLADGTVLVGLNVGLGVAYSDAKGYLLSMAEDGRDLSNVDVRNLTEDREQRIWIATADAGILCLTGDVRRPKTLRCHQYSPENNNYPLFDATAVYEDREGAIWAISASGGLFLYDSGSDAFVPVNHRFHLFTNSIYSICGDDSGWLWLSTDRGLLRMRVEDGRSVTSSYSADDGLDAVHFSPNGYCRHGSEVFYGCSTGFFSFQPDRIDSAFLGHATSLRVTQLIIDDRPYQLLDSVLRYRVSEVEPSFARNITIPSSVKKFSVEFSLLSYQNQEQCRYFYFLEGYDRDWHFAGADDRRATYQNLPPGTYRLQLYAVDSYARRTELPYSIAIVVLPPWYKTWWAYLVYAVLLAAAAYGVKEWYKARLNHRARLQQRVSELLHYREMMVMKQFEGARKVLEAEEQQHSSPDEQFLTRAIDCVKQHLDDSDYDREQFASDMCVSSSTLYNKLRALTDQNVTSFINSIRLKEACRILRQRPDIKMTELSMAVGFNTPKYFTKCFKKEFGVLPSEYVASLGELHIRRAPVSPSRV